MSARYTAELANGFGNLASRVTAMVVRYFDGRLPGGSSGGAAEHAVVAAAERSARIADERMCALDFSAGLAAVWELVDVLNGYITEQAPWKLAKDDPDPAALARVLTTAAEGLRVLAVLLNPVMPKACARIWSALGADAAIGPVAVQRVQDVAGWGQLPAGSTVTKLEPLFPRLED